jgi:Tol biopolymer transport system component
MRSAGIIGIGLLAACSSFGAAPNATPDGGSVPPGAVPPGSTACDSKQPFSKLTSLDPPINGLTSEEFSATLSLDQQFIVFASSREGQRSALYTATRTTPADVWTGVMLIPGLNGGDTDVNPTVTADLRTLYFQTIRQGTAKSDLWYSTRKDPKDPFPLPLEIENINSGEDDSEPWVNPAGTALYFTSTRSASVHRIYKADLTSPKSVANVALVDLLAANALDVRSPILTADELTIFFATNTVVSSDYDIWTATRPSKSAPFQPATAVAELHSPAPDFPTWLSPDGCSIMFESKRDKDGKAHLYSAARLK